MLNHKSHPIATNLNQLTFMSCMKSPCSNYNYKIPVIPRVYKLKIMITHAFREIPRVYKLKIMITQTPLTYTCRFLHVLSITQIIYLQLIFILY